MSISVRLTFVVLLLATTACQGTSRRRDTNLDPQLGTAAPRAEARPHELTAHGHTRIDPYYWLRDRENSEVIAYLTAENEYAAKALAPSRPLADEMYREMVERIPAADASVPVRDGDWVYYTRIEKEQDYSLHCRRPAAEVRDIASAARPGQHEQILVDENELAEGHEFFSMSSLAVSPDASHVAFGVDTVGRRFYTLRFKDLESGTLLPDVIPDVTGEVVWANDNRTVFYTKQDPETLRSYRVLRHVLGSDVESDALVYEETDPTYDCWVGKTKSKQYLTITSDQTLNSEIRVADASDPGAQFRLVARRAGHKYWLEHHGDHFYLVTDWDAINYRLMRTPVGRTERPNWEEVIPHRDAVLLSDIEVFDSHLVVSERRRGLQGIRILDWDFANSYEIPFDDPTYVTWVGGNRDTTLPTLRYFYSSLAKPTRTYEIHLSTHEQRLLKEQAVGGDFEADDYVSERVWATSADGTSVPISIVRHRRTAVDGSAPLLLEGYGSYGSSSDPWFSSTTVSLLDRGFIYAVAHIRGGSEMGRQWYEDGKLLAKQNTFTDFNTCARHLINTGYADPERVYAQGGSAGGLLMGAIINLDPELYHGVLADVPFVDVVTTMLDETIPLTTSEYDEWGDPRIEKYYRYMLSYSPYDQVRAIDYPHLFVTTGLHDSQVQYWEPAKWVAKLRATKTDDNLLILKTNMTAGHGGASGRYPRQRETATQYGFLAWLARATATYAADPEEPEEAPSE